MISSCLSQEAINEQFVVLYDTPIKKAIPNGPTGIDAYVCCPKIKFGGQSISDDKDKYRMAVIRFKFREANLKEIKAGKKKDSIFTYKSAIGVNADGDPRYIYPEVVINVAVSGIAAAGSICSSRITIVATKTIREFVRGAIV